MALELTSDSQRHVRAMRFGAAISPFAEKWDRRLAALFRMPSRSGRLARDGGLILARGLAGAAELKDRTAGECRFFWSAQTMMTMPGFSLKPNQHVLVSKTFGLRRLELEAIASSKTGRAL